MSIGATLKSVARGVAWLRGVSHAVRMPSVRNSLAGLSSRGYLPFGIAPGIPWERVHPFDIAHGTDTSGFVSVDDLDDLEDKAARVHARPYGGSQPSIIRSTLAALSPLDSFTFVDLGCGKGRPLLVASEFPFQDIVGVELSAPLARAARQNAALIADRFPKRTAIRVVTGDAGKFPLPAGNVVLFLYNPFGDDVMERVAQATGAALTAERRTIYVVYYNPVAGHCFDALPQLRRHFAATVPYAADELGYGPDTEDPIVVWQSGLTTPPIGPHAIARIEIVDPRYRVKLVNDTELSNVARD